MRANPGGLLILGAVGMLALPALAENTAEDSSVEHAGDVRQVEARLGQLQEESGPYTAGLSEPLAELGMMHLRDGEPAEARKAFRRAMQVERVNLGLYTPQQVRFLDLAIESSVAARDWAQVDDDFRYLEWLSYRMHGQQGPELADDPGRIIDWHLAAIHLDEESKKGKHLLRLLELSKRRVMLTEEHYGASHA